MKTTAIFALAILVICGCGKKETPAEPTTTAGQTQTGTQTAANPGQPGAQTPKPAASTSPPMQVNPNWKGSEQIGSKTK